MSFLLLIPVLFVLILVHEFGHYITAKKTGMRVDEFGIGFPPKLYSTKKGETEYSLNALPIGGFVRIFGEDAVGAAESGDFERSFVAKSKIAQTIVLLAGVFMNVLLAWLIFIGIFMHGYTTGVAESNYSDATELVVVNTLQNSPAAEVGVEMSSVITGVSAGAEKLELLTPSEFRKFTEANSGQPITLTFANSELAELTPRAGVLEDAPEQVVAGVALALQEQVGPMSLPEATYEASVATFGTLGAITVGIYELIVGSITGAADFSQVAGPVGIGVLVGQAADVGFIPLLFLTASLSLSLAVINLLPFPALDGGRLLFVLIEAVTQKQINPEWVMRLNIAGFILLMVLMVAVTWNDIIRFF